jgi:5'-3' exoribonuclease 2
MGVPQFFRYLSEKYPRIMVDCVEELLMKDGCSAPVPPSDVSAPNPNNIEFDNLYLDMNGIIHPCTHPEDGPAPTTESEMFLAVFEYIDRIVAIVRPRKVLYMAIDGVAPRAKINQQRSRRFRSAKEAQQKAQEAQELKRDWAARGLKLSKLPDSSDWISDIPKQLGRDTVDLDVEADEPFDSNVITPGTPFMDRLAIALKKFAAGRVASTPGWKDVRILFSDASVPGEGEHKIAEYIRVERATPGYDPNIRHVLYGLDADLIMLALATHEAHFSVLREEVFPKNGGKRPGKDGEPRSRHGGKPPHARAPTQIDALMASADAAAASASVRGSGMLTRAELGGKKPFQFLHVNVLREYLDLEFRHDLEREIAAAASSSQPGGAAGVAYDLERVIDDFVFLCFFVGNDFLPHLPTLDIREGAIDYIIEVYKTDLAHVGYITSGAGDVDFDRAKRMLSRIGTKEDEVFQERKAKDVQSLVRDAEHRKRAAEAKERQKLQKETSKAQLPDRARGDVPPPVSSLEQHPAGSNLAVSSAPVTPPAGAGGGEPVPHPSDLMVLGDKNKKNRIGDGTANREAAAKFKRNLEVLKQRKRELDQKRKERKATALARECGGGDGAGSATPLPVAAPPIAKRGHGTSPTKPSAVAAAAAAAAAATACEDRAPSVSAEADPVPELAEEKTVEEFEEELKERLDAQNVIENPTDNVRLGDEGWKDRYYLHKFNWGPEDDERKAQLFHVYLEGLYWVMKYYYVGCISWVWYYPYHYAPFASDIVSSSTTSDVIKLEMGSPFPPFTQLQAVMPASSGQLVLPTCYSRLMTSPTSPIIDYYPDQFEIDLNGKRFAWQGVALLPFIDEQRLRDALAGLDEQLTDEERKRNAFGDCWVIAHAESVLGKFIDRLGRDSCEVTSDVPDAVADGQLFGQLSPRGSIGREGLALAACFTLPPFKTHETRLLDGVQPPPDVLDDFMKAECAQRGGWKPARFGSLGRAARELSENRDYRLGGGRRRPSRGGGRSRGVHGSRDGGSHGGGSFQSQAPIINPPVHPAAAAMFGGLGGSSSAGGAAAGQPSWMMQGRSQYRSPYQEVEQPYHNAYGAQALYGNQYVPQGYGSQAHASGAYSGQYGAGLAGGYAGNGGAAPAGAGGYNFSADPSYYSQNFGAPGATAGGGLAGPTAMQMRQAANPYVPLPSAQWSQVGQGEAAPEVARGRGRGGRGRGRGGT